VKRTCRYLPLLSLLLFSIPYAGAQSSFDLNLGFGTAHANGIGGIENINSLTNPFGLCTISSADPTCVSGPKLGGFFLGLGGDVMLTKRYGIGMEAAFQPAKSDYAGLNYRQTFYDFNGIFSPLNQKRVIVELQGGLGGTKTSFSYTQNCAGIAVCSTQSQPVLNTSHFQIHAGVGVQLFVTDHVFIRPQFDLHYVPNFTDQFGSNLVPAATVWVGYSFGDR
jgi:hypothetical protein